MLGLDMYFYILAIIGILLPIVLFYLGFRLMWLFIPLSLWLYRDNYVWVVLPLTLLVSMFLWYKNMKKLSATILVLIVDLLIACFIIYAFMLAILSEI